jgi:YegS/Rv2252/BmrU family lipid kinase
MNVGVIVNPRSAGGKAGRQWNALHRALTTRLGTFEVRFTERPGHGIDLARALVESGCELVVGIGGDGTINEIANGLLTASRSGCIGILPFGTGGDLRRTLGIPKRLEEAIEVLAAGRPLEIDVGEVSYLGGDGQTRRRYFVNLVSFGMGGEVAGRSDNFLAPLGGRAAFLYASMIGLLSYRGRRVELSLENGDSISHSVLNIAIGNGRYHGGGMHVCPEAVLDDGELDVTVIENLGMLTLAKDLSYLYNGKIFAHPKVHHFHTRRLRATSDEVTRIEVDGEPLGSLPIEVSVVPKCLRVLVPARR